MRWPCCKRRLPGIRVKHRAKMNWVKMVDKAGSVLRVETVINQPDAFTIRKRVRRGKRQVTQWVPMRKGVANLLRYREASLAANKRYLEALAVVDDQSTALKHINHPSASSGILRIRWSKLSTPQAAGNQTQSN